jgi:magnesium transporter
MFLLVSQHPLRHTVFMSTSKIAKIPSFVRATPKRGLAPGSLLHVGRQKVDTPGVTIWTYDATSCAMEKLHDPLQCCPKPAPGKVMWINVDGVHDPEIISALGRAFDLHSLLLEDVLNTTQRPKVEEYDGCLFLIAKMLHHDTKSRNVVVEQVSLIMKEGVLLSFQEQPFDAFDSIRERLRAGKGRLRSADADYLFLRLLDAVVDEYFVVLDAMGHDVEKLEAQCGNIDNRTFISDVYSLRRQLLFVRKAIHPLRDILSTIQRSETTLLRESSTPFLRDVYDHALQSAETIETYRDLLGTLLENHLSVISHRTNSSMHVLTVVATIFIPLTFIAGIYGMNFRHMPELEWQWGYPAAWMVMLVVGAGMYVYFKRR